MIRFVSWAPNQNIQGSRVRPNFSRVRLKKIWGRTCATSRSRTEKKVSTTLSLPVLLQQTHIRLISWSNQWDYQWFTLTNQREWRADPKRLSMMHFCYSQIRRAIAHVEEFQHAQHESPVYDRRELTIKTCLHFRPVAVILNCLFNGFLFYFGFQVV